MAEKEERILVRSFFGNPCTDCDGEPCSDCVICGNDLAWDASIPRKEAIERMAKAIWEAGYHEVLNTSFDELKTKSHKSKSRTFSDFYKLTMERAEAAMNALLEEK